jgi:CheY-like chemotaxis protein
VLGRLKHHPATRSVPVIVCTILPEAELAISLGADGFIQKPFSREGFLAALRRQLDRAAPAPG